MRYGGQLAMCPEVVQVNADVGAERSHVCADALRRPVHVFEIRTLVFRRLDELPEWLQLAYRNGNGVWDRNE